ncbi:hypothetical protein DSI38_00590 [Mycobacterium tuberculosis]|nr:hypothetical protein DSI38_00590 [Mycobacterium tuberculosis]
MLLEVRSTGRAAATDAPTFTDAGQSMYVTGRWVSQNVVSTMFVAWLIGVAVFVGILLWQRRKHRDKAGGVPRASSRKRKPLASRHHRRNGR